MKIWKDMYSVSGINDGERPGGGVRGEIEVFSPASRYRLFQTLHKLEFKTVTFVTLTYPRDFPRDAKIYKAHLKEYRRRFELKYGKVRAVWRLEFQKRGAPHYHLFYLDAPFIPVREWCALWSDVIHTQSKNHRKIGVDVKLVADRTAERLIASYVGKYVAKINGDKQNGNARKCGRWWGKWNIVEESPIEIEVVDWQAKLICDVVLASRRGGASWQPIDATICTIFGSSLGRGEFGDNILRLAKDLGAKTGT